MSAFQQQQQEQLARVSRHTPVEPVGSEPQQHAGAAGHPSDFCRLYTGKKHMFQSFVAKVTDVSPANLYRLGNSTVAEGCVPNAWAVVHVPETLPEAASYVVVTTAQPRDKDSYTQKFRKLIEREVPAARVHWCGPLTRRLQRLFGWGDVAATREDFVRACEDEDVEEMKALMPAAAALVDRGSLRNGERVYDALPALYDAMHSGPAAIQDCEHQFFGEEESRFPCARGPCARCATNRGPRTRCQACETLWCQECALEAEAEQRRRRKVLRALHEVRGAHDWQPAPGRVRQSEWQPVPKCGVCNAAFALVCACGAGQCDRCEQPPARENRGQPAVPQVQLLWEASKDRPRPSFWVVNYERPQQEEKLWWITQEIGANAELPEFAAKFVDLFGENIRGKVPQQKACLELFAAYTSPPCPWRKESDMPLADGEEFETVWDPDAPKRCRECSKRMPAGASVLAEYCSDACRDAGRILVCSRCGQPDSGPPTSGCRACELGKIRRLPKRVLEGETALDKNLKRNRESLNLAARLWFRTTIKDPNHQAGRNKRGHS